MILIYIIDKFRSLKEESKGTEDADVASRICTIVENFQSLAAIEHDKWVKLHAFVLNFITKKKELFVEDFNTLKNFQKFDDEIIFFWTYPLEHLLEVHRAAQERNWLLTNNDFLANSDDVKFFFNAARKMSAKVKEATEKTIAELNLLIKHDIALETANSFKQYAIIYEALIERNLCLLEVPKMQTDKMEKRNSAQLAIEDDSKNVLDVLNTTKNHVAKLIIFVQTRQHLLEGFFKSTKINLKCHGSIEKKKLKEILELILQFEITDAEDSENSLKSLVDNVARFSKMQSDQMLLKTPYIQLESDELQGDYAMLHAQISCIKNQKNADNKQTAYDILIEQFENGLSRKYGESQSARNPFNKFGSQYSLFRKLLNISIHTPVFIEEVTNDLIETSDQHMKVIEGVLDYIQAVIAESNLNKERQNVLIGHFMVFRETRKKHTLVNSVSLAIKLSDLLRLAITYNRLEKNDIQKLMKTEPKTLLTLEKGIQMLAGPKWKLVLDISKDMLKTYCGQKGFPNEKTIFIIWQTVNIIVEYEKLMAQYLHREYEELEACFKRTFAWCSKLYGNQLWERGKNLKFLAELRNIVYMIMNHSKAIINGFDFYVSIIGNNYPENRTLVVVKEMMGLRREMFKMVAGCVDLLTQLPGNNTPYKGLAYFFGVSTQSVDEKKELLDLTLKKIEVESPDMYSALVHTFDAATMRIQSENEYLKKTQLVNTFS